VIDGAVLLDPGRHDHARDQVTRLLAGRTTVVLGARVFISTPSPSNSTDDPASALVVAPDGRTPGPSDAELAGLYTGQHSNDVAMVDPCRRQ